MALNRHMCVSRLIQILTYKSAFSRRAASVQPIREMANNKTLAFGLQKSENLINIVNTFYVLLAEVSLHWQIIDWTSDCNWENKKISLVDIRFWLRWIYIFALSEVICYWTGYVQAGIINHFSSCANFEYQSLGKEQSLRIQSRP